MVRKIELSAVINIIVFTVFALLVFFVSFKYYAQVYQLISEPERFKTFLVSYGQAGIPIFILFQVLQVVIAAIPGEFVQIAGGYIYGTWAGTLFSALGIMLGYLLVFLITRLAGYPLVKYFVSVNRINKLKRLIQAKKTDAFVFFLFLVPGIPKDFLVYAAGLTPIEPVRFFIIVILARFPAMLGASFIGANLEQRDYTIVVITFAVSVCLFVIGLLVKERVISEIEKRYPQDRENRKIRKKSIEAKKVESKQAGKTVEEPAEENS